MQETYQCWLDYICVTNTRVKTEERSAAALELAKEIHQRLVDSGLATARTLDPEKEFFSNKRGDVRPMPAEPSSTAAESGLPSGGTDDAAGDEGDAAEGPSTKPSKAAAKTTQKS